MFQRVLFNQFFCLLKIFKRRSTGGSDYSFNNKLLLTRAESAAKQDMQRRQKRLAN